MLLRVFRVAAFSTLTIFAVSCGGGGTTGGAVPAVQTNTAASALTADAASYGSVHFEARPLPPNFVPSAMMRDGSITGSFGIDAAIYRHGRIENLGTFNGENGVALFVNAWGDAVGYSSNPNGSHALLFSHGHVTDLGRLPPTFTNPPTDFTFNQATVISDRGTIYGTSSFGSNLGGPQIVRFSPNNVPAIVQPNAGLAAQGLLHDINAFGAFAFVRSFGDAPLGPLPAVGFNLSYTFLFGERAGGATAINDLGATAGFVDPVDEPFGSIQQTPNWKAFVKTRSSLTILPNLSGATTMEVTGLNDRGDAVGPTNCDWAFPTCPTRIFVYRSGRVFDAAKLLPSLFAGPVSLYPGMSNTGYFVIMKGTGYYRVGPGDR